MANQSIQVEYHHGLGALEKVLSDVRRSGDFFVQGNVEVPMPKLEVQGVGVISFPVPETQNKDSHHRAQWLAANIGLHKEPPHLSAPLRATPKGHRQARGPCGIGAEAERCRVVAEENRNRALAGWLANGLRPA